MVTERLVKPQAAVPFLDSTVVSSCCHLLETGVLFGSFIVWRYFVEKHVKVSMADKVIWKVICVGSAEGECLCDDAADAIRREGDERGVIQEQLPLLGSRFFK
jgi:hypothetical protein